MRHDDLRTPAEIFDDMLADEKPGDVDTFDRIAARLGWTWGQARRHYLKICDQLGVRPDEERA